MIEKRKFTPRNLRASKFEAYLDKKKALINKSSLNAEKSILDVLRRPEAENSGEQIIRKRLLRAYEELDLRRRRSMEDLEIVIPGNFEFSEYEIVAMDSEINYPYDSWDTPFLPKVLYTKAFDQLVKKGLLQRSITYEVNEDGIKTGNEIRSYRKPKSSKTVTVV